MLDGELKPWQFFGEGGDRVKVGQIFVKSLQYFWYSTYQKLSNLYII